MTRKVTLTLEEDVLAFVEQWADSQGLSRSACVNALLNRERQRLLELELEAAYKQDAADPEYLADLEDWDVVVGDGIA